VGTVANALADFTRAFSQSMSKLRTETEQFRSSELKKLLDHTEQIDDQFRRTRELLDFIQSQNNLEKEGTDKAYRDLQLNHQIFESEFLGRVKTLKTTFEQMCCQTIAAGNSQALAMETSLDALHTLMDGVLRQATDDITEDGRAISEVKALADAAASEEIARLKQQNEELSRLLDRGRVDAEKAKDELVKRVSGLLGDFLNERQVSLKTAIEDVQAGNAKAAESHQSALKKQHEIWRDMESRVLSSESVINRTGKDLKRLRDGTFKVRTLLWRS
jgi:kinesin family protein 11